MKEVKYYGQPVGIIVANREKVANKAANLVKIKCSSINTKKPMITINDVLNSSDKNDRVVTNRIVEPTDMGNDIKMVIHGDYNVEGQYQYTIEPQTCVVKPTEDGMEVYASTQSLDIVNVAISQCLNIPANRLKLRLIFGTLLLKNNCKQKHRYFV